MTDPSQYVRERHNDGRRDVRWPDAPEPLTVPVYDNHAHLEIGRASCRERVFVGV